MQGYAFGKPELTAPWTATDGQPALDGFGILENRQKTEENQATALPGIALPAPA